MKVVADDIWVCADCYAFAANGEPDEAPEGWSPEGVEALGEHVVCADGEVEFSHSECETCGALAGARYELAILGEES